MINEPDSEVVQVKLENLQVGGNITIKDITQIYQTVNNLDNIPKPTGFPQNIPKSNTDKFVGREGKLKRLYQQLQRNDEVVIAAVEGMGGVGKTELAIQYSLLHLQLQSYPGGICWLQGRAEDIGLQIVQFARTDLGLPIPDDLELPERVRWCWQHWRKGNTLIVLDDVTNYGGIKPYLPPQPSQFKVIITTRLKLDLAGSLFLEVLQESDALLLLNQLIGEDKVKQESAKAQELCQRLGYLPLALQLVGRYVKKRKINLAQMLRRLEEKGLAHPSLVVDENDPTWTLNVKRGVAAAFELSWAELSEPAQHLGCLLSLFALVPIPWNLVESVAKEKDAEALEDARVELENLHLIQGEDSYRLHRLIQEFFRDKQNNLAVADEQKYNYCAAMVEVAQAIPQKPVLEDITTFTPIIRHLAEAAKAYHAWLSDEDLIWPFVGLSRFYESQGAYAQALPWREQCVSVAKERFGEQHPSVATSYNNLAGLYESQGRYSEAEPLYQKALQLYQQLLGEQHPHVAMCYNNLALLYNYQGRYSEAEPLYQQALQLRQQLLGELHPDVASSYNNLALLYNYQGRYNEAESLYQQALQLYQQLLGEQHQHIAMCYNNLAALYNYQGRYSEAEPLYQKALQLRQQLLGEQHPDVAASYNNLALLYDSQGKYSEAEPLLQKALQLWQQLLGEQHPHVATSYNSLAKLYYSQGRYSEAEPLLQKALQLTQQLLGEQHPHVATSYNNLAKLYYSQSRYSEAEALYLQALQLRQQLLGKQHPDVASSYYNLAELYDSQGRYSEAEPLYLQALQLYQQLLGEQHPDVAISYNNLALFYYYQGRYSEAEPLYLQALQLYQQLLGEQHPDVATSYYNLAKLYYSQSKYGKAEPLFQKALQIAELSLGVSHPSTITFRENLAICQQHNQ
ncbi:tetratricopeptide repeat protein [Nostoc spongiaeforme FACHB-130]|uniref:Tetratricopeptide repeat protein n=1 Tax=Nostoc spongiaeforme FACHB-130 TaxID=1357510 RepID=A0ABR8FRH6_9NOSO|nr:tetratricopeptide repeat protein [Nostoc spongiaeforme]MBD2594034.1 tetratricopeptide repeat protein [Nostoc spongiaeforme FACHB-130]